MANEDSQTTLDDVEEDPDVIIPDDIARPLLYSSNLMLVTALLAGQRAAWPLAVVACAVWITSLLHWSAPRFSSWRRLLDYVAVASIIVVGSWTAVTRATLGWMLAYFAGLSIIGCIFAINETLYYHQLQRNPIGGRLNAELREERRRCECLKPARGVAARHRAYRRAVWVHLLCVHVLASALSCTLLVYGTRKAGVE